MDKIDMKTVFGAGVLALSIIESATSFKNSPLELTMIAYDKTRELCSDEEEANFALGICAAIVDGVLPIMAKQLDVLQKRKAKEKGEGNGAKGNSV